MTAIKMQIQKRTDSGKNPVKKMRKNNVIPAVVYSRGGETVSVSVDSSEFLRVYKSAGSSSLLGLELEGEKIPAIIKEIQRDPVKNRILHVDFQKLNMDEKVKMTVPIVLLNRDNIKLQPSILTQILDQIEIECLPSNIPNGAEVDVADMDFTTPIMVKDLSLAKDSKVTILRELDDVVCTLSQPSINKEDEDEGGDIPEATEAAPDVIESEE
ncbi:large subunit ribosomal protein L25 [Tissierella praeacuta DSM 18095]|uniref:Large ribosomal subunit protein bL25 n=1 Tax=Tissierella praeacuta DSM 18095 TaxID=1123404 RepID=A0A1M4VH68_9FIRM|nr:50S ribosomal protein L25 [Tissierella praeacuta]TCU79236.1 large subunit ribosomal protein L25 [Tissierella praeacuta]SHE68384.1 large subunit ribosomal protein L25 [Tissierella praeacuta DSM 18095]SUO99138.1 General stress protein CTC [Tissierella praeacuta]